MRYTLIGLFLALMAVPAWGQGVHLHEGYCGAELDTPEARQALAAYQEARTAGHLARLQKGTAQPPTIGDKKVFNVKEEAWQRMTFTLKDTTSRYYLWVEDGELTNNNVTDGEISGLRDALLFSTPSKSFNPGAGVIANDHAVFGEAPNYDGDGKVDILLYDIGKGTSSSTIGYFHPQDLNPNAAPGEGNQADVIYLDANEGTRNMETLVVIAAHEYMHLIHARYGIFEAFIAEGLAEYAMVMNGYYWRNINYLPITAEHVISLFTWRDGGGPDTRDYQRAGLFTTYIAHRIGPLGAGAVTRTRQGGAQGYETVMQAHGTSLAEILSDFHTANYLNNVQVDPRFGYPMPERQGMTAPATRVRDGRTSDAEEGTQLSIKPGAVRYLAWDHVGDFSLSLDAVVGVDSLLPEARKMFRVRAIKEDAHGKITFQDLPVGGDANIKGAFKRLTIQVTHVKPSGSEARFEISTFWRTFESSTSTEDEGVLPERVTLAQNYPNPFNPTTTIRYTLPQAMLVRLAVYDLLGRQVVVLAEGLQPAGTHEVRFDAADLAGGLYLYALEAEGLRQSRTMTLVK